MEINSKPLISVCILTFNRSYYLGRLLDILRLLTYTPMEIIVIDNCSSDNTELLVKNDYPWVKYARSGENVGAAGRNLGFEIARGDIIVTLDDDIEGIDDISIGKIVDIFRGRTRLGALNFQVINSESGKVCNWIHHCEVESFHDKEFATYEITEGAVAFRRDALAMAGYYADYFFLSHEGPDLAFRVIDKGYEVLYSGDIVVRHLIAKEGRSEWRRYYFDTRNQLWVAARHFPFYYTFIYLLRGLSSMLVYSIRDGFFLYWVRGVIDGLLGLRRAFTDRKVLSKATMRFIRDIDSGRPPFCRRC